MSKLPLLALISKKDVEKIVNNVISEYEEDPNIAKKEYLVHALTGKIVKVPIGKGYRLLVVTRKGTYDLWKYIASNYIVDRDEDVKIVIVNDKTLEEKKLRELGKGLEVGPAVLIAWKWEIKFKVGEGTGKVIIEDKERRVINVDVSYVSKQRAIKLALATIKHKGVRVRRSWDDVFNKEIFREKIVKKTNTVFKGKFKYLSLLKNFHCIYVESEGKRAVVWINRLSGRAIRTIPILSENDLKIMLSSFLGSDEFNILDTEIGVNGLDKVKLEIPRYYLEIIFKVKDKYFVLDEIKLTNISAKTIFHEITGVVPKDIKWRVDNERIVLKGKASNGCYYLVVDLKNPLKPMPLIKKKRGKLIGTLYWFFKKI